MSREDNEMVGKTSFSPLVRNQCMISVIISAYISTIYFENGKVTIVVLSPIQPCETQLDPNSIHPLTSIESCYECTTKDFWMSSNKSTLVSGIQ